MSPLPQTPELEHVAARCVWYRPPAEALHDATDFIAHVLTYGMPGDVAILRKYVSDVELAEALDHAPPGVFDPRSWAYWHLLLGRYEAPPMPVRKIP